MIREKVVNNPNILKVVTDLIKHFILITVSNIK